MPSPSITPSPTQLKALTHPVRVRMLGLLRVDGPATATTLATRLGLNTGATSYHLRQLAQHGFIEDDAERGNGRERWWRAAHLSTHTDEAATESQGGAEVLDAYLQSVVTVFAEQLQRAVQELPFLPAEWRRASEFSDWIVRVTPPRARELTRELSDLLYAAHDQDDPAAVPFVLNLNAYPMPGHLGGEPE